MNIDHRPSTIGYGLRQLPALKAAILIAVGITVAGWMDIPVTVLAPITILTLFPAILLSRRSSGQALLALSLAAGGALIHNASTPPDNFTPIQVVLTGRITEPPVHYENSTAFPVQVQSMGRAADQPTGEPANLHGKVWVKQIQDGRHLSAGADIRLTGSLRPTPQPRNPGDFDLRGWRARNGYIGELHADPFTSVEVTGDRPPWIYRMRNGIAGMIERYHGSDAPLVKALMLGLRRELDPTLMEDLKQTGLSHLLALSGLHIGFLAGILLGIGVILRLKLFPRVWLAIACILLFTLMVPVRGATLRAFIMAAALLSGTVFKRWGPSLNTLAFAALIILCFRPGDLFDAGFQLSFAAVGGIILLYPKLKTVVEHLKGGGRSNRLLAYYLLGPFLLSLSATVMVLPLTSHHFGLMALGTPLFNLAAVPLLWFIFAGAWAVAGLSVIWPAVAALAADGLSGAITLWEWTTHLFAQFAPAWSVRLAPLTVMLCLATVIWAAVNRGRFLSRLTLAITAIAAFLVWDGVRLQPPRFQAWFLDVGHGDASLWLLPDGRTAVIDGGPYPYRGDRSRVGRALKVLQRRHIDLMVASHPEADHIGGLIDLVERFPVGLAITGTATSTTQTCARLSSASANSEVHWHRLTTGAEIHGLGHRYQLKVLGPPAGSEGWSANDASLVLLLDVPVGPSGKLRLLTTGDVERNGEAALVRHGGAQAELLKVPHHGSATSSSPEFLAAVSPVSAVISRPGPGERRGYTSYLKVLRRYEADGIEIHHTGKEGAVLFEPTSSDGKTVWRAVDWRKPPLFRWLFGI